jgi:hypothetical protein
MMDRSGDTAGLLQEEYIVIYVVAAFERTHLADRLDRIQPTVLFRFGLEGWCGDQIAIAGLQFFAPLESIYLLLATLHNSVIASKDQIAVVGLDRLADIDAEDAGTNRQTALEFFP